MMEKERPVPAELNLDGDGFATEIPAGPEEGAIVARIARQPTKRSMHVYKVEDAVVPSIVANSDAWPHASLPENIPFQKVLQNIQNNLNFGNWSDKAKTAWFKNFCSDASVAVISDAFWYSICRDFKQGAQEDTELMLFDRISENYVGLFNSGSLSKDFFFRYFADATAQAVLYSMFLAYPKSRGHFTSDFRKRLISRFSVWTMGLKPEFIDTSHWKLNLGGGDVLESANAMIAKDSSKQAPRASPSGASSPSNAIADKLRQTESSARGTLQNSTAIKHLIHDVPVEELPSVLSQRAPKNRKQLRYSPLIQHFMDRKKYKTKQSIQPLAMRITAAEGRQKILAVKQKLMRDKAQQSRNLSQNLVKEYGNMQTDLRRQITTKGAQMKTAKMRLDARKKEVLRPGGDAHEYANYLTSLHALQQIA